MPTLNSTNSTLVLSISAKCYSTNLTCNEIKILLLIFSLLFLLIAILYCSKKYKKIGIPNLLFTNTSLSNIKSPTQTSKIFSTQIKKQEINQSINLIPSDPNFLTEPKNTEEPMLIETSLKNIPSQKSFFFPSEDSIIIHKSFDAQMLPIGSLKSSDSEYDRKIMEDYVMKTKSHKKENAEISPTIHVNLNKIGKLEEIKTKNYSISMDFNNYQSKHSLQEYNKFKANLDNYEGNLPTIKEFTENSRKNFSVFTKYN